MRILIAGNTYYPGTNGQASFTIHLAEGLKSIGHDVVAVVPNDRLESCSLEVNGVHVEKLPSIHLGWIHPAFDFTTTLGPLVNPIFDRFKPDIVHIQDHYPICWSTVSAARRRHIPMVGTNHFLPENLLPKLTYLPLPRRTIISLLWDTMLVTYNHLNAATTPTETAATILRQQKIHIPVTAISCGVDTSHFQPLPPSTGPKFATTGD